MEIRWVGFFSIITIFFVFWFILEVHSYNKVGELFMHTLRGQEYAYKIFFPFCTLAEYLQNVVDIFSLVFLIVENCFVFFPINFVSSKAYTMVSNNYKKIMKFTLTLLTHGK